MNIIKKRIINTKDLCDLKNSENKTDFPKITSFLIKVTARCNLNCDYCYVFSHADQSWKKMPSLISLEDRHLLAKRLAEYAKEVDLDQCLIVFHGGEPLLVGVERLIEIIKLIKNEMPSHTKLYFSMQTNGTLLTKEIIESLEKHDVGISLSLDGPKVVNDLHRLYENGNSSFEKVLNGYELLQQHPNVFSGVLGVIDPRIDPKDLFSFFAEINPPAVDFLLPDSNYLALPPLRDKNPHIYRDWLIEAFNVWYDQYPELTVRLFEGILGSIVGLPSPTDALGFGDISLLSIETNGFYHDLDVFKITTEDYSSLNMNLREHSILDAVSSPKIALHRKLLSYEGLSSKCQACPEVKICGGGSVPHRYSSNGFSNPTVYCEEMLSLISHIRKRFLESLTVNNNSNLKFEPDPQFNNLDLLQYEKAKNQNHELDRVYKQWLSQCKHKFLNVLPYVCELNASIVFLKKKIEDLSEDVIAQIAKRPSTILWVKSLENHKKNLKIYDIDGQLIPLDTEYLEQLYNYRDLLGVEIHCSDKWLRFPFGNSILFEGDERRDANVKLVEKALSLIEELDPALRKEIDLISPCIQLIQDPSAHPDKIVSFSDNMVPGALYVSIRKSKGFIDPYDLADSIIHEHRHQKLYLLEQYVPVVASDTPLLLSPWRKELRPVSGVFHGVFVFQQLKEYWRQVYESRTGDLKMKAKNQMNFCGKTLGEALMTLKGASITEAGKKILNEFENVNSQYI